MWWYRYHRRFVGVLALVALGIQLVVSFGHVHLEGARVPFGSAVSDAASLDRLPVGAPDPPGAPQHDCPVCVSIYLLANALTGEPAVLSLPTAVDFEPFPPVGESEIFVTRFYPFRTRAPPVT